MAASEWPESLQAVLSALTEDEGLREWYESLAEFSLAERRREFQQVAHRLAAGARHPELAHVIAWLGVPGSYEIVRKILPASASEAA